MHVVAEFHDHERDGSRRLTPLLRFYIQGAPHRRQHIQVIAAYREVLRTALKKAKVAMPIRDQIDVSIYFINPASTDLGNSYLAFEQAMDKYLPRGINIGILDDDSLIQRVEMAKMYVNVKGVGAQPRAAAA